MGQMSERYVARKESTRWAAPNTSYDGDDWGNEYDDSSDSYENGAQVSPTGESLQAVPEVASRSEVERSHSPVLSVKSGAGPGIVCAAEANNAIRSDRAITNPEELAETVEAPNAPNEMAYEEKSVSTTSAAGGETVIQDIYGFYENSYAHNRSSENNVMYGLAEAPRTSEPFIDPKVNESPVSYGETTPDIDSEMVSGVQRVNLNSQLSISSENAFSRSNPELIHNFASQQHRGCLAQDAEHYDGEPEAGSEPSDNSSVVSPSGSCRISGDAAESQFESTEQEVPKLTQFNHIGYVDENPQDHSQDSSSDDQVSDALIEEQELENEIAELYQGSSEFLNRPISTYAADLSQVRPAVSDKSINTLLAPRVADAATIQGSLGDEESSSESEVPGGAVEPLDDAPKNEPSMDSTASLTNSGHVFVLPSERTRIQASTNDDERRHSESNISFASSLDAHDDNRVSVSSSVLSDIHESSRDTKDFDVRDGDSTTICSPNSSLANDSLKTEGAGVSNIKTLPSSALSISKRVKRPPHIDFAALFNSPGSSSESRAEQMRVLRIREHEYSTGLETWITATYAQVDPSMTIYTNGIPPEATGLDLDTAAKISSVVHTSTTSTKEKLLNVGEKSKSLGTKSKSFFAKVIR